jgi:hypothetical protein
MKPSLFGIQGDGGFATNYSRPRCFAESCDAQVYSPASAAGVGISENTHTTGTVEKYQGICTNLFSALTPPRR